MTSRKIKEVVEKPSTRRPRPELLLVAEAVAREKEISQEEALAAMEGAIQRAAKAKYGLGQDIRAHVDRATGEITLTRAITVAEVAEDPLTQISLEEARLRQPGVDVGFEFFETLPPMDFGRAAAMGARQVVIQKVREAERERQYAEFIGRKGEIVSGIVKHVSYGQTVVDIGRTEGVIRAEDSIPRQSFRVGDRIRALLVDIRPEANGPMLILSRTHNDFVAKLFEQEVTEVYDGWVKIMAVARDPGSRTKMAVYSAEERIDPVGICVGVRGSHVQAISAELQDERIDIIPWSSDPATYAMNALSLPEVRRVVIDEEDDKIDVVVADDFLSQAIGRRGQNIRLASLLTGWKLSVISETDDVARRASESTARIKALMDALGIDEMTAQLLISEGFLSVEDIAESEMEDFVALEGLDPKFAKELYQKAVDFAEEQEQRFFQKCEELGIHDDLLTLPHLDVPMFDKLIDAGIRTRDDVADLATDELLDILSDGTLSREKAEAVIMEARKGWFNEDGTARDSSGSAGEGGVEPDEAERLEEEHAEKLELEREAQDAEQEA